MAGLRDPITAGIVGLLVGGAVAAFMMAAAYAHNPHGEIHVAGAIAWRAWLVLGALWLALTALPVSLLTYAGLRLRARGRSAKINAPAS